VALANPLAETQSTMRRSLVPALLAAVRDNLNQGERAIAVYEQGRVFAAGAGDACRETERLALVLSGTATSRDAAEVGFADVKGVVETILDTTAMPEVRWQRSGGPWLDEAATAVLVDGDDAVIGAVGRLDTSEADRWGLKQAVYVAELDLEAAAATAPLPRFEELPRFPAVVADMTVEHDAGLTYGELVDAVWGMADALVGEVTLVTRFTGSGLPEGAVRTTLRMVYRHPERSLTQDEVNAAQGELRAGLAEKLGVTFA
jgi:phenylalanyl-tRNA synthetase beta chain